MHARQKSATVTLISHRKKNSMGHTQTGVANSDWIKADWRLPVKTIAGQMGCSSQWVYQVMHRLGIKKPQPTREELLLRIDTERYTLPQLAQRLRCSEREVKRLLRFANRVYRVRHTRKNDWAERQPFADWLVRTRKYSPRVAANFASRCARLEVAYGIQLRTASRSMAGQSRTLSLISSRPGSLLTSEAKRSALGAYRLAAKRYFEFLASNKQA